MGHLPPWEETWHVNAKDPTDVDITHPNGAVEREVISCISACDDGRLAEDIPRARLIAAAPDLYRALEASLKELLEIAEFSGSSGNWPLQEAVTKAEAALKKARGET